MESAVILGTVVYDQILTAKDSLQENCCNKMELNEAIGGSMYNIAWNLAKLQVPVHLIAKLGNDELAIRAQSELENLGGFIYGPILDRPTPRFYLIQDDIKKEIFCTITPEFFYQPKDPLYLSAINHCTWGITDLNCAEVICELIEKTPQTRWIFSGSIPSKKILRKITGLILNEEELLQATVHQTLQDKINELLEIGLNWLIVTQGQKGAQLHVPHASYDYPSSQSLPQANSLGCGDAFAAGLLYSLLCGQPIKEAAKYGIMAAELTLETPASHSEKIGELKNSL